jgi:hypothetical protein
MSRQTVIGTHTVISTEVEKPILNRFLDSAPLRSE